MAALGFAEHEGFIPPQETSNTVKALIDEALKCKRSDEYKTTPILMSGYEYFDMSVYETYLNDSLRPVELP